MKVWRHYRRTHSITGELAQTLSEVLASPAANANHAEPFEGEVTFRLPNKIVTMPLDDFGSRLTTWNEQVTSRHSALTEALRGLLRNRDFLCLQLDHAWGNISDDEFNAQCSEYLDRRPIEDLGVLRDKVRYLLSALGQLTDAHTLASMFECRIEDVEQAMLSTDVAHTSNHQ